MRTVTAIALLIVLSVTTVYAFPAKAEDLQRRFSIKAVECVWPKASKYMSDEVKVILWQESMKNRGIPFKVKKRTQDLFDGFSSHEQKKALADYDALLLEHCRKWKKQM